MSLFICWVLFPLLFCALALGAGLLVQAVAGRALPGVLLVAVGYAAIVVASQITTYSGATTFLATPLVIVLALAGYGLAARDLRPATCDLAAASASVAVFGTFAAPVVLSGHATFLGYTLLGDDSIHFALIDRVMSHGHSAAGLAPSSYQSVISSYFHTAYPLGAHTAIGAVRPLVGQDVAWVYQPYLALLAAFAALSIYSVMSRAIGARWLTALAAFLAAQGGLVYAYALEGSIKELATVCLIATAVAVGAVYVAGRGGVRTVLPLAVVVAAAIGVLNTSVLPWLGPALLAIAVGLIAARGGHTWRALVLDAGVLVVLAALLSYPSLAQEGTFIRQTTKTLTSTVTSGTELGNLLRPLNGWQAFGIWPSGDFRVGIATHTHVAFVLIGLELGSLVLGTLWALRRGSWWPLVFLGASVIGWAYITARSNAWGDGKALMILSPAVVAAAMLGPASLLQNERQIEALGLAGLIAFGVLWTNALAYHQADIAPRDRLGELARIGERFAGQGPTLYTEFEEFGKYFLRKEDPSGSDEAWQANPRGARVDGGAAPYAVSSDVDQLVPSYVQRFRTLVLRRSGSASRPPSNFRLVFSGRFYGVWQRTSAPPVRHLALGDPLQPGAVPRCALIRGLASGGGTRLAYVERPELPVLLPARARHPAAWAPDGVDPTNLRPLGAGTLTGSVTVANPGPYAVWVQGSFGRHFNLLVDSHRVGIVQRELGPRGEFAPAGTVTLLPGGHTVQLVQPGGSLYPGDGGHNRLLGPVVFDPLGDSLPVKDVANTGWRSLCGRRLDWIESIR